MNRQKAIAKAIHRSCAEAYQQETPTILIIQNHLENIIATYGREALIEIVTLMGLNGSDSNNNHDGEIPMDKLLASMGYATKIGGDHD